MRNFWWGVVAAGAAVTAMIAPSLAEPVQFDAGGLVLSAEVFKPSVQGLHPAVVALHGCSGLYDRSGKKLSARHRDWAERLVAAGYVVMFPDSFTARGTKEICTLTDRPVEAQGRAADVSAAMQWLVGQPGIDRSRISLLGWSHGAMTVLWAAGQKREPQQPMPAAAIAFYPGCREVARDSGWRPNVPLTVLAGGADDWTAAEPCRALAGRTGFRIIVYPDAYHDFDAPNVPVHVRTGLSAIKSGSAHVGTNPAARDAAIVEVMAILASARAPVAR